MRMVAAILVIIGLSAAAPALGQAYPQRPVTVVVGAPPGGSGDTAIRIISDRLSALLGQPIVIENVSGAGGMTATARVARAAPDGYTLLVQQTGLATIPALYPKAPFDVEKDLVSVGLINRGYSFIVGRNTIQANNFSELISWMKASSVPAKIGFPGVASFGHLWTLLMMKAVDRPADLIPYRGVAPLNNDILAGQIDLGPATAAGAVPFVQSGRLKAFAYGGPYRHPSLPDVPTFAELGFPELSLPLWQAVFVPAGTPTGVIERLNTVLREVLKDSKVKQSYATLGLEAFPPDQMSPEAATIYVKSQIILLTKIINDANIQIQQ